MTTVKEMLDRKGSEVLTIGHLATVFDAVQKLSEHNVGALVVTMGDEICGILSERDYLRHVVVKGRSSRETPVVDIMSRKVIYGDLSCTAEEVLNIMTEKHIRHLPIMDNDRLAGMVSIGDCVKTVIKQQEVEIKTLKEYITDAYPGPTS